jgi:L-alanine-DL-glutamate epimerase-like enolase superfamily enzyme
MAYLIFIALSRTSFSFLPGTGRHHALSEVQRGPSKGGLAMMYRGTGMIAICVLSISLAVPSYAQLGGGQQDAARILNGMSPDTLAKVQSLAQILQQGIKDGKISDAEIQQGLTSGQLGEKLKQLSPEATQLLEEISDASRQGKGPGEESLMPLMGGLGISPN